MKFKSNKQRKAVMAKLSQMSNPGGFRFKPENENYVIRRYLKTNKAKQMFNDQFPKSRFAPLRVAQDVESQIKKDNDTKRGIKTVPKFVLKSRNYEAGYNFFSEDSMRFFGSRIESEGFSSTNKDDVYFVTSEESGFNDKTRAFSVRKMKNDGSIDTVGEFLAYKTRREAIRDAKDYAQGK